MSSKINDKDTNLEVGPDEAELSPEEFEQLVTDLEEFEESFFELLAGSEKYEIIPNTDESGNPLTKKQYALIRRECTRLGLKVLYVMDKGTYSVIYSPETGKIGVLSEEIH